MSAVIGKEEGRRGGRGGGGRERRIRQSSERVAQNVIRGIFEKRCPSDDGVLRCGRRERRMMGGEG